MPIIETRNLQTVFTETRGISLGYGKFLRQGLDIYVDLRTPSFHKRMARDAGMDYPEDGGRIKASIEHGVRTLTVYSNSFDLKIPRNIEGRNITIARLREIAQATGIDIQPEYINDILEVYI